LNLRVEPPELELASHSTPSSGKTKEEKGKDGEIYLEDARQWVQRRASLLATGRPVTATSNERFVKYDYIIHDVFSGGSVPSHLFSMEFWSELKTSLLENGVLAVNFAGRLGSPASRGIFLTLKKSFPAGECKAYHDDTTAKDPKEWLNSQQDQGFFNMVFFCADFELKHRKTVKPDWLGSPLRERILTTFPQRDIPEAMIVGDLKAANATALEEEKENWIIRDSSNRLGQWQTVTALEHWKVMREVMPAQAWELY